MTRKSHHYTKYTGFRCVNCNFYVSIDPMVAGVQNRNHCPHCLWSKHMDLNEAGDRLAACKAKMQPIGLSIKQTRKKYGPASLGELMLIHRCVECGKVTINRIAADDDAALIYKIYMESHAIDVQLKSLLETSGIRPLGLADIEIVRTQLFGKIAENDLV